jgi:hypothetical protein
LIDPFNIKQLLKGIGIIYSGLHQQTTNNGKTSCFCCWLKEEPDHKFCCSAHTHRESEKKKGGGGCQLSDEGFVCGWRGMWPCVFLLLEARLSRCFGC